MDLGAVSQLFLPVTLVLFHDRPFGTIKRLRDPARQAGPTSRKKSPSPRDTLDGGLLRIPAVRLVGYLRGRPFNLAGPLAQKQESFWAVEIGNRRWAAGLFACKTEATPLRPVMGFSEASPVGKIVRCRRPRRQQRRHGRPASATKWRAVPLPERWLSGRKRGFAKSVTG